MGNCCGGTSRSDQPYQVNNVNKQRSRREQNWAITGQINLRDANLKELPSSIAAVGAAARQLDASNNKLSSLPASLPQLQNLQRLIVANNVLVTLPDLATLTTLKVLVLDGNRLTELPPTIGRLARLEKLHCSKNALTALPGSLSSLQRLTVLNVSVNKILSLPSELGDCAALEDLDTADNYLSAVPASLGKLTRLRSLSLDKNRISELPGAILVGCTSLQTLSLHSNPISAEVLEATEGWPDFDKRRRSKYDKQIGGGVITNLDEGVDRNV